MGLKVIKVSEECFTSLTRVKALMELQEGKRITMNEIITHLVSLLPNASLTLIVDKKGPKVVEGDGKKR